MKNARHVWIQLCKTVHGVDSNGDEVTTDSALGLIAESQGIPTTWSGTITDPQKKSVADFLREWADAIEAGR